MLEYLGDVRGFPKFLDVLVQKFESIAGGKIEYKLMKSFYPHTPLGMVIPIGCLPILATLFTSRIERYDKITKLLSACM